MKFEVYWRVIKKKLKNWVRMRNVRLSGKQLCCCATLRAFWKNFYSVSIITCSKGAASPLPKILTLWDARKNETNSKHDAKMFLPQDCRWQCPKILKVWINFWNFKTFDLWVSMVNNKNLLKFKKRGNFNVFFGSTIVLVKKKKQNRIKNSDFR